MLTMDDIIREGHPTLREIAKEVPIPITKEDKELGEEMLQFLINSQDPVASEEYHLRGGVGLAAPQLNISKRIIALYVPIVTYNDVEVDMDGDAIVEEQEPIIEHMSRIMINPKVVSHSVQLAALADGEGCLSVDRPVEGNVVRARRVTITYYDENGVQYKEKFRDYDAIVVQHEIDHLNGIMFFDHINPDNPMAFDPNVFYIE